jgi:hypothetical protein
MSGGLFLGGRLREKGESPMSWSRDDDQMLKMGVFWGDTAEEVAAMLSKEVSDVLDRACEFQLPIKRLASLDHARGGETGITSVQAA